MKKNVVIFEAEGGSDKWFDGHRKDTMPIANALKKRGWNCDVLYFRDEWKDDLLEYVKDKYDAYISRINPGNLPNGEEKYFDFLEELTEKYGMLGMATPKVMINFGAKDALAKLADTELVPDDTYAYYDVESFHNQFPVSLSYGERVTKQNRGSTGSGIWRVIIEDNYRPVPGQPVPLTTKLKCTEAVDNHTEYMTLREFMEMADDYIRGENGLLVDMPYLPRIKEGELRLLMVGDKTMFVVHKKPADAEDAFSATLFSGAKYTYYKPEEWEHLIDWFRGQLPMVLERLGVSELPLIWTADFILDYDENGKDKYVLGELNASCVGFTSHLDLGIQDVVAEEVIRRIAEKK